MSEDSVTPVIRRDRERLDILARIVADYLDTQRADEGVDEWDESDPRCAVYNAAYAVLERDSQGGEAYMDDLFADLDPAHDAR